VEIFVQLCGIAMTQKTQNKSCFLAKTQRRESILDGMFSAGQDLWERFCRLTFADELR
jgi:hypothetical protein